MKLYTRNFFPTLFLPVTDDNKAGRAEPSSGKSNKLYANRDEARE